MLTGQIKYYLLLCIYLIGATPEILQAQEYKDQIGMEVFTLTDRPGSADPLFLYNTTSGDYLALYTVSNAACATAYELRGQIVRGTTGTAVGNDVLIASGDNACGTHQILHVAAAHDAARNRYLVFYVSQNNNGAGSVQYVLLDGNTLQKQVTGPVLEEDLLNPYRHVICTYNSHSDNFTLGYHKNKGSGEGQLYLRFVEGSTGTLTATQRTLSANDFGAGTLGVHRSAISYVPDAERDYLVYEVGFSGGSEVWCSQIDTRQQSFAGTPFRVSGTGAPSAQYKNPAMSYDGNRNRLLVVYEKAQNEGVLYSLATKIHAQAIACSDNTLLQPLNFELSQLPFVPACITCGEQVKRPAAGYSPIGGEYFVPFYGVRPASQEDLYDVMGHRIDAATLSKISQDSYRIVPQKGTSIATNKTMHALGMAHNPQTNQFLLGWHDEANNTIEMQIRRLENNPPMDVLLSAASIAENQASGTPIGDITTIDPDPDDSHTYVLENLAGKTDADLFEIRDGKLTATSPLNYEETTVRSFRIRTVDSKNDSFEKTVQINVEDRNDIPDSVRLSTRTVAENSDASSLVGTISVYDQDESDTHTLQLTSQTDKFELQGTALHTRVSFDHEATPSINVGIRCQDSQGGILNTTLRIEVTDVNEAPTGISTAQEGFFENRGPGAQSLQLVTDDEDDVDSHTFALVAGAGDIDNSAFRVVNGDKLQAAISFDFENKAVYSIRLRTVDKGQLVYEGPVAVQVVNVNEQPANLALSNNIIEEGMPVGTVIGRLSVTDPDGAADTHTYTMEQGGPDLFVEENGTVRANNIFTYLPDQPQSNFRNLTVRATDKGGLSATNSFAIEIIERQDHQRPIIVDLDNSDRFDDSNPSKNLEITVADDNYVDSVIFYYKGITGGAWQTQVFTNIQHQAGDGMSYATLQVQLSKQAMDEMGIAYHFKVVDPSGNDTLSDVHFIYRLTRNKNLYPIHNAPFDGTITTYRIMAMPYDVSKLDLDEWLGNDNNLGAYDPAQWRLFHYNNQRNGYEEYPAFGRMETGKGYWFNAAARIQATLDNAVASVYNEDNLCTMELREGWNQIGNPYPFDLSWEGILEYNTLSDIPLYLYQSGYIKSGILPAFTGALVYISQNTSITIPFARPASSGREGGSPAIASLDKDSWQVDLALHNGDIRYAVGGFGMHPEALHTTDRYDEFPLPRFIQYADYKFFHPDHKLGALSRDIVPTAPNHMWEFTADCNTGHPVSELTWSNEDFGENSYHLILYDVEMQQAVDMRTSNSYVYDAGKPRDFRILFGDRDWTKSMLQQAHIRIAHPYPNPFEDDFVLPLELPKSNRGYTIEVRVTNTVGADVLHKSLKLDSPGPATLQWSEIAGASVIRSGVYIYTVLIENGNHVIQQNGKLVKH
jgi:hypothetical protein